MPRRAPTALVSLLALVASAGVAGCASVDQDDVAAIEELPGVAYASSSCDLAGCHVSVRVDPLDAEQLAAVLDASRETGADSVTVRPDADGPEAGGTWDLELQAGSDPAGDAPAAAAALAVSREPDVERTSVVLDDEGTGIDLRTPSVPWDVAEDVWPEVDPLVSPRLSVTSEPPNAERPSRIVARGALPDAAISFVRAVAADTATGWTGAVVDGDSVVLGAVGVEAAEALEARAAQEAPDLDVEVVVSTNVLGATPGSAAAPRDEDPGAPTEADRRAVLTALATEPRAWARVQQGVVLVDGEDLDLVADLVDDVRAAEPDAASRVPLTVGDRLDAAANRSDGLPAPGTAPVSVQLHTGGSTDLVRLVADLRTQADLGVIDAEAWGPGHDEDPPEDVDARIFVQVASADLPAGVRRVSALLAPWASADVASLRVSISTVDPEGRTPRAGLRVERQGDAWVAVEGSDNQTEETSATALEAWTAGAAG